HSVYAVTARTGADADGAFSRLSIEGHDVKIIALMPLGAPERPAGGTGAETPHGRELYRVPVKVGDDIAVVLGEAMSLI
ncbi:MAG: hypothetical protein FWH06_04390, partial [Oscillospiraceae bacterium]|nr:hypothetical protein [Oscillospiraceae bacterium]